MVTRCPRSCTEYTQMHVDGKIRIKKQKGDRLFTPIGKVKSSAQVFLKDHKTGKVIVQQKNKTYPKARFEDVGATVTMERCNKVIFNPVIPLSLKKKGKKNVGNLQKKICNTTSARDIGKPKMKCYREALKSFSQMRKEHTVRIRRKEMVSASEKTLSALFCNPDGLTKSQISALTGTSVRAIERHLQNLPEHKMKRPLQMRGRQTIMKEKIYHIDPPTRKTVKNLFDIGLDPALRMEGYKRFMEAMRKEKRL